MHTQLVAIGLLSLLCSCSASVPERQRLLALPLDRFDQHHGGGWREVANRGHFAEAAALIDDYVVQNGTSIPSIQQGLLQWHAGQLYAYAGQYAMARTRMLAALDPNEPDPPFFPWNDYVRATIAFLDGHRDLLTHHRSRIAATTTKGNLRLVDSLIERFGQAYAVASPYAP